MPHFIEVKPRSYLLTISETEWVSVIRHSHAPGAFWVWEVKLTGFHFSGVGRTLTLAREAAIAKLKELAPHVTITETEL